MQETMNLSSSHIQLAENVIKKLKNLVNKKKKESSKSLQVNANIEGLDLTKPKLEVSRS